MNNLTVTVCIPTCNRPDLLHEAVKSCLNQTRKPEYILIGDDSSIETILFIYNKTETKIELKWNNPRLGQNANVNSLFDRCTTDLLVLLHDDDLLLPNAIEDMARVFEENKGITAVYGKQIIMSERGVDALVATENVMRVYHKTPDMAGLQGSNTFPGLTQQFPNDSYMIRTAFAQAIKYSTDELSGDAGDFHFGLKLDYSFGRFYFIDKFVAKYRVHSNNVSSSKTCNTGLMKYKILLGYDLLNNSAFRVLKEKRLKEFAPIACMQAIKSGDFKTAWEIWRGPYHPTFTLGSLRRLLKIGGLLWKISGSANTTQQKVSAVVK